jgi:hypothetical protein
MDRDVFVRLVATLALLLMTGGHLTGPVSGQTARQIDAARRTAPRARDGHPNIEGTWTFSTGTPLERPAQFAGKPFMTDEEAKQYRAQYLADRRAFLRGVGGVGTVEEFGQQDPPFVTIDGQRPTSVILDPPDGRLPDLTLEAQPKSGRPVRSLDGPEDLTPPERCLRGDGGPPMLPNLSSSPFEREVEYPYVQIVETQDEVVFVQEGFEGARIVPLDRRPHLPDHLRSWLGDSRGRWSGDTLIVETTNFRDQAQPARRISNRYDRNLRVVERLSRVSSDMLWYEFTVDDPTIFTKSWSGAFPMRRSDARIYEVACHEGNYAMLNMLRGSRVKERTGGTVK